MEIIFQQNMYITWTKAYCISKTGFVNHLKSHNQRLWGQPYNDAITVWPEMLSCHICGIICKSKSGLTRHSRIQSINMRPLLQEGKFLHHICECLCRTEAGLKTHLCAHNRTAVDWRDGKLLSRRSNHHISMYRVEQ